MAVSAKYTMVTCGTHIVLVKSMSADVFTTLSCERDFDLLSLSMAFVTAISTTTHLPHKCIHLLWGDIYKQQPSRTTVWVEYTTRTRDNDGDLSDADDSYPWDRCFICEDPCDDADDYGAARTREEVAKDVVHAASATIVACMSKAENGYASHV